MPSTILRKLAAASMLAVAAAFLGFVYSHYASAVSNSDYQCYWTQGQLLAHSQNPYDSAAVGHLEYSVGWRGDPMINRMTPLIFPIVFPLGFVSPGLGGAIWSLMIISVLMLAVRSVWVLHGKPEGRLHLAGYLFAPALACILAGQGVVVALAGLALFLRFERVRAFLGGLCLALCLVKPHLFVPFGAAFCLLVIANRRYRLLAGLISGVVVLALLATLISPHCWIGYQAMLRNDRIEGQLLPNLSMLFRMALNVKAFWLQFVPSGIGTVWALWYARRHQHHWRWAKHGSLVLLVSVLVAPYSCFTDEVVLLPAMLIGIYASASEWRSWALFGLCEMIALTLLFSGAQITSLAYVWTPLAWLACFSCATRKPHPTVLLARGESPHPAATT